MIEKLATHAEDLVIVGSRHRGEARCRISLEILGRLGPGREGGLREHQQKECDQDLQTDSHRFAGITANWINRSKRSAVRTAADLRQSNVVPARGKRQ
jgi:hypothetical protein